VVIAYGGSNGGAQVDVTVCQSMTASLVELVMFTCDKPLLSQRFS